MPAPFAVELLPHSPAWARAAETESRRLTEAFHGLIVLVHHIGSTAVPGIHAKPIIDLLPVVKSLYAFDARQSQFVELGYRCWSEYGIPGRRYCTFDDPATGKRAVQLHCFEANCAPVERHLAFRDYLRANPSKAHEYDLEKQRCSELYPLDSHAYTDAKAAWIEAHLAVALANRRSPH
jgi:GrpB-like predicted nucleotidyltransferase (UPF0157 family)